MKLSQKTFCFDSTCNGTLVRSKELKPRISSPPYRTGHSVDDKGRIMPAIIGYWIDTCTKCGRQKFTTGSRGDVSYQ